MRTKTPTEIIVDRLLTDMLRSIDDLDLLAIYEALKFEAANSHEDD